LVRVAVPGSRKHAPASGKRGKSEPKSKKFRGREIDELYVMTWVSFVRSQTFAGSNE